MGREVRCPDEWERLIRAFPTRRDVVKLAGLAGVAALPAWVSSCLKPAPTAPPTRESSPPRTAPIEGYANATSYRVGETASFQVSNNSGDPRIEVEVVRAGAADTSVLGPWHDLAPSQSVPRQPAQYGCGWSTTFQFVIPSSWSPTNTGPPESPPQLFDGIGVALNVLGSTLEIAIVPLRRLAIKADHSRRESLLKSIWAPRTRVHISQRRLSSL